MTFKITVFPDGARKSLEAYLARPGYEIPAGIGTEEAACSVTAINLALGGGLTDTIPPCMSAAIGHWIITVQDAMPRGVRNAPEWRALLPDAAASGREPTAEHRRLRLVMSWMWGALEQATQLAVDAGYGSDWEAMLDKRTADAAEAASIAARTAARAAGVSGASAEAAVAVRNASECAAGASWAAAGAARGATFATDGAWATDAARAARNAVDAVAWSAEDADKATADAWRALDPAGLLDRLIKAPAERPAIRPTVSTI